MNKKYSGIKPGAKKGLMIFLVLILAVGAVWGINKYVLKASIFVGESKKVSDFQLADMVEGASLTTSDVIELPSFNKPVNKGTKVIWQIFPWNAQFPLMYATGGVKTSKGSLMEKAGVDIEMVRQDDCFKTIADFIKNTKDLKDNPNTVPMFISFMGDGMPGFSVMLKDISEELGEEYRPIIFYTMGRSNGEDAFMGPSEWKTNPKACLGKTVIFVERDGDGNIVFKWSADNDIPVNTKTKYYDPNALNVITCSDFIDGCKKYISGYTESRILIRNGKTMPDSLITVGIDAVATWTPGDVMVAEQKGGLVRLASTKEYASQMPNVTVVCRKWAYSHMDEMQNIIIALAQAGDQVRSFEPAQEFAAKVSAEVYKDKDWKYWLKYYKGVKERDAQGIEVELGGSMAFNLTDAANMLGLGEDRKDRYKVTYETFGSILKDFYPKEMEGMLSYQEFVDKGFLNSVIANHPELLQGKSIQYTYNKEITSAVSNKVYNISFELNSDVIKESSYRDLDNIYSSATIAEGLKLGIYGHTDASGEDLHNQNLSERRAASIAKYLATKGITYNQMEVKGYGEDKPVFGTSADTRNRCVEIVLGN